jgi:hypothetical protein
MCRDYCCRYLDLKTRFVDKKGSLTNIPCFSLMIFLCATEELVITRVPAYIDIENREIR